MHFKVVTGINELYLILYFHWFENTNPSFKHLFSVKTFQCEVTTKTKLILKKDHVH